MKYLYYPGCSLEGTALEYNVSTKIFMQEVGADLVELEDWTCCGVVSSLTDDDLMLNYFKK